MKKKKALLTGLILYIICLVYIATVFAHSGRTDASGGHRDNFNESGLGSYHYHCGGYPPHLHTSGICPYQNNVYSSSYDTPSFSVYEDSNTYYTEYDEGYDDGYNMAYDERYDEGYDDGYSDGYDIGYDEGRNKGYDDGHNDGYYEGYEKGYKSGIEDATENSKKEFIFLLIVILAIFIIVQLVKFINKRRKER